MQGMKETQYALVFGHWHSLAIVKDISKCKWYLVSGIIFIAIYTIIPISATVSNTWTFRQENYKLS